MVPREWGWHLCLIVNRRLTRHGRWTADPGQTLYPWVDHRTWIHCCIEPRPFLEQWEFGKWYQPAGLGEAVDYVRMVVWPWEAGKSVTKSMAKCDHGPWWGWVTVWRSPAGSWCGDLDVLPRRAVWKERDIVSSECGPPNLLWGVVMWAAIPGWPELGLEWTSCILSVECLWNVSEVPGFQAVGKIRDLGFGDFGHNVPLYRCENDGGWNNGFLIWGLRVGLMEPREGICLGVLRSGTVSNFEVKSGEEEWPPCLSVVESLGWFQIL